MYQDTNKLPTHEFGIYSIYEKTSNQRPILCQKTPSPPPPLMKMNTRLNDLSSQTRPQNSRVKEAINKVTEKERDWSMKLKSLTNTQKTPYRGDQSEIKSANLQRTSGAGDPKAGHPHFRASATRPSRLPAEMAPHISDGTNIRIANAVPVTTFRTSQVPIIKSVNEARNFLVRNSWQMASDRENNLKSSITVTQQARVANFLGSTYKARVASPNFVADSQGPPHNHYRRRLGRSPSPQGRVINEQSRATNTPLPVEKFVTKDSPKSALKDALSKLKLVSTGREGSLGAASLGANRDAPRAQHAPSVRSDERTHATQGDMLNSIKFQRRLREALATEKAVLAEKPSGTIKKGPIKPITSKTSSQNKASFTQGLGQGSSMKPATRSCFSPPRPMSPKGRRTPSFY